MPIVQSHCILTLQILVSVNSGKSMQRLEACCWINEWRNRQFNKQTNATISARVECNFQCPVTPEDPSEKGSISSLRNQSPEHITSVLGPLHKGHSTVLPFPADPDSLLSPLCVLEICHFTVSVVFLMKSKWCPMWLGKKMRKQQQNYMFFFSCSVHRESVRLVCCQYGL